MVLQVLYEVHVEPVGQEPLLKNITALKTIDATGILFRLFG